MTKAVIKKPRDQGNSRKRLDWEISREIRTQSAIPVLLAGGLKSDNVGKALRKVGPAGVDLCSGLRTAGNLDERKLLTFMSSLRHVKDKTS